MLQADISALPPGVVKELIAGRVAKDALTIIKTPRRQDIQARMMADETPRTLDGLGRPRMCIEGTAFHYWGQRLGYDCWKDKQFLNEFERDNPAVRIKSGGTRIQSGYTGNKRFSKTYA